MSKNDPKLRLKVYWGNRYIVSAIKEPVRVSMSLSLNTINHIYKMMKKKNLTTS